MASYHMYILYSESRDRYYIGSTGNLQDRLLKHNSGGNKSTKAGRPWKLVYTENFSTSRDAVAREQAIKRKKRRSYIEWLIDNH